MLCYLKMEGCDGLLPGWLSVDFDIESSSLKNVPLCTGISVHRAIIALGKAL